MRIIFNLIFLLLFAEQAGAQSAESDQLKKGAEIYYSKCLTCHQQDGSGVPNLNPPLTGTTLVKGSKPDLIKWVLTGTPDQKTALDGVYYANNMPSQMELTNAELADVLTYIRKNFGNNYSVITESEVQSVRSKLKKD